MTTGIEMVNHAKASQKELLATQVATPNSAGAPKASSWVRPFNPYRKGPPTTPTQWHYNLTMNIDRALEDCPPAMRLKVTIAVLEELMFEEWEMPAPAKIVLKPHPSREEWLAERRNEAIASRRTLRNPREFPLPPNVRKRVGAADRRQRPGQCRDFSFARSRRKEAAQGRPERLVCR